MKIFDKVTCQFCKKEISAKSKYCPYCLNKNPRTIESNNFIFIFIIIVIVGGVIKINIENKSNNKSYSNRSSINRDTKLSSAANTLATLDNFKYTKSSYEYYIKNIMKYCDNSESSIADIVYITQELIYENHGVKPSLLEIIKGLNIAVENNDGIKHNLREVAAIFATIY